MEHQGKLVGDLELGGPIGSTVCCRLTPILEEVELAVAVEVLEHIAVDLDEGEAALRAVGQRGAAFLGHELMLVDILLGPLGGAAAELLGIDRIGDLAGIRRRVIASGRGSRTVACSEHAGSGGDCADLEEVPSRKLCHISLLLPMPLRAFLRELPGNSG